MYSYNLDVRIKEKKVIKENSSLDTPLKAVRQVGSTQDGSAWYCCNVWQANAGALCLNHSTRQLINVL